MNPDIVYESDYDAHAHYGLPACHRVRVTMHHVLPSQEGDESPSGPPSVPLHPLARHAWSIQFDPNICVLDEMGDVESTTRMFVWPWKMTLSLLKLKDQKALYDVELMGEGAGPAAAATAIYMGLPLRLVAFGATAGGHPERLRLLVFDQSGKQVVQMIELLRRKARPDTEVDEDGNDD